MNKVNKFWAYKVLPLVYDSSLSYLEVLQKLVTKINEVITTTGEMAANVVEALKNSEAAVNTANEAEDKAQEALNKANNIPTKTSDLTNDSGFVNAAAAAAAAPVQSVNNQTGNVLLSIPTKTSDLNNDSGFIDSSGAPVQSVNGKTGTVLLDIPENTSDLVNDSNFITRDQVLTWPSVADTMTTTDLQTLALTRPGAHLCWNKYGPTSYSPTQTAAASWVYNLFTKAESGTLYIYLSAYDTTNSLFYLCDTSGTWYRIANYSDLPTKVSDLTNDSAFITNTNFDYSSVASSVTSMATSTWTELAKVTLPSAGIFIISATIRFAQNSTGNRRLIVSSSNTGNWQQYTAGLVNNAPGTDVFTQLSVCYPIKDSTSPTLYLFGWQNSGSSLTISNCNIRYLRISTSA